MGLNIRLLREYYQKITCLCLNAFLCPDFIHNELILSALIISTFFRECLKYVIQEYLNALLVTKDMSVHCTKTNREHTLAHKKSIKYRAFEVCLCF